MLIDFLLLYAATQKHEKKNQIALLWPAQGFFAFLVSFRYATTNPIRWLCRLVLWNLDRAFVNKYANYRLKMKIVGNGYSLACEKNMIILYFGQSHFFNVVLPSEVSAIVVGRKKRILLLQCANLLVLQNFSYLLQKLSYPDIYRGKGLRYVKQQLRLKEGKKKFV